MAMASLGWRSVTVLLVSLAFLALGLVWLPTPWGCRTTSEYEADFGRHMNLSTSITFPLHCEEFLLQAEESSETRLSDANSMPLQGWSGGEWYYPQSESSDVFWTRLQRMLGRDNDVAAHEVSFTVTQTAPHSWLRWPSQSNSRPRIEALEGRLELRNFWGWIRGMEPAMAQAPPQAEVAGFNPMAPAMRNLEVGLKGGFVNKGGERRVCMTGCAYRHDQAFGVDCGFVLKMTYPKWGTMSTARGEVEAEFSSSSWSGEQEALNFPAVRIVGPTTVLSLEPEYLHKKYRWQTSGGATIAVRGRRSLLENVDVEFHDVGDFVEAASESDSDSDAAVSADVLVEDANLRHGTSRSSRPRGLRRYPYSWRYDYYSWDYGQRDYGRWHYR